MVSISRKRAGLGAIIAAGAVLVGAGDAAEPLTEHTVRLEGVSPPATLDQVAWLVGRWSGTGLGGNVEEIWTRPADGVLCGMFTAVKDDAVTFHEIFTIVEERGSLVLLLKHFTADLVGWEAADVTVRFPLVRVDENAVYFEGLTYRREGDQLRAFVSIGESGERAREAAFTFERVSLGENREPRAALSPARRQPTTPDPRNAGSR